MICINVWRIKHALHLIISGCSPLLIVVDEDQGSVWQTRQDGLCIAFKEAIRRLITHLSGGVFVIDDWGIKTEKDYKYNVNRKHTS
jgi:hypothetical protein